MLNLYPYLCADPDMDLSPIRAKSERLYRDILRERQFYNEHPECDNVHFFHLALQLKKSSVWVDRWGIAVMSLYKNCWSAMRISITDNPSMRLKNTKGYGRVGVRKYYNRKDVCVHILMADIYLPNTDFTKCQLDHLNGEHLDNNAFNLERVTPEENIRRREIAKCLKKGQPIPWKYQSIKNYLNYLQCKNYQKGSLIGSFAKNETN